MVSYEEALNEMRREDSELYKAIREAYYREQFEGNTDQHCQGVIAAIHAVFNLGQSIGFKRGFEYAESNKKERI